MTAPADEFNQPDPIADVDVTTLTRQQAHDFRLELTHALVYNPMPEGVLDEVTRKAYKDKIEEIKAFLGDD